MNAGEREMYVALLLSQAETISELERALLRLRAPEINPGRGERENVPECGPGSAPKPEPPARVGMTLPCDKWYIIDLGSKSDD